MPPPAPTPPPAAVTLFRLGLPNEIYGCFMRNFTKQNSVANFSQFYKLYSLAPTTGSAHWLTDEMCRSLCPPGGVYSRGNRGNIPYLSIRSL